MAKSAWGFCSALVQGYLGAERYPVLQTPERRSYRDAIRRYLARYPEMAQKELLIISVLRYEWPRTAGRIQTREFVLRKGKISWERSFMRLGV